MKHLLLAAVLGLLLFAAPASAQMALPSGFEEGTTVGNLTHTVGMAYAPDGRIFMVTKGGLLRVARGDGTLAPKTILDISEHVNHASDRGLLGVAVDKDFATNGWVYLLYVGDNQLPVRDHEGPVSSRLTRVTVNPDNTIANPSNPETVILGRADGAPCPPPSNTSNCIPADFYWHLIGTVRVDPVDGTLWLGSGDATGENTQAQAYRTYDETSFAGKLIHIDRNGNGLEGHPFCKGETDLTKVCTKLHAKGFRNPFRFTLRPNKHPIVGDVGYATREEIDVAEPGGNYGWPCYEGNGKTANYQNESRCLQEYAKEGTTAAAKKPLFSYDHNGGGASVTVGPQYTGGRFPSAYANDIFFGDYAQGWIKRLNVTADDQLISVEDFATDTPVFTDFQQDPQGRLAVMDVGGRFVPGAAGIRHIDYSRTGAPTARASATPTSGSAPLQVQFTGTNSTDPTGQPLTYDWDFGDGTAHSTSANPVHTYTATATYTATLKVTDSSGLSATDTVAIRVGTTNQPPTATITTPVPNSTYTNGEPLEVKATASDLEDGTLPDSAYAWQYLLHHNTHVHVGGTATGPNPVFTPGTDHDADSHYELRLTVTDADGATTSKSVEIVPRTVKLTLNSSPPGAPVTYSALAEQAAPRSVQAAVGFKGSVSAAPRFVSGGRTYRFDSWSDGGSRTHQITVPTSASALVARYVLEDAATVQLAPAADASVDASAPTVSDGTADRVQVDGEPVKRAFLRFDVNGVAARRVLGTRLGLYTFNPSADGPRVSRAASGWSESVTWNTQPSLLGQLGTFPATGGEAEWYETRLAAGAVTGDGALSLGLDSGSQDGVHFASRETHTKPALTVEVEHRRASAASAPTAKADFDGDGREDLAIGVPEEDLTGIPDAGAVHILYGGETGVGSRSQIWTQSSSGILGAAEMGDAFGAGLAAGDFNGDGRADLAVGAPGDSIGAAEDAGVVHVLLGGASGLASAGNQMLAEDSAYVADAPETGDAFGMVLSAGDVTGDNRAELAVGVPREDTQGLADSGAFHLLRGSASGLTGTGSQYWTQASTGMGETPEAGDELGGALAMGDFDRDGRADLAASAAYEDLTGAIDAGVVHVLRDYMNGLIPPNTPPWSQASADVPGEPEAGDRFGSTLASGDLGGGDQDDLVVGVPDEDIGAAPDAGWISVLYGGASGVTGAGSQRFYQGDAGVEGAAEAYDRFGGALAVGDVGGSTKDDLVAGAAGDSIGTVYEAGVVHVLFGSATGPSGTGDQMWSQNSANVADGAETADRFGASVAALDLSGGAQRELVIGAPGEMVGAVRGAGAVHVLPGAAGGPTATGSTLFNQNTTGIADVAERGDGFGGALGP